jgi:hypothetical protein
VCSEINWQFNVIMSDNSISNLPILKSQHHKEVRMDPNSVVKRVIMFGSITSLLRIEFYDRSG